jgi:hypothetical protein
VLGRKVAIKLLHPEFASDEGAVKRFQREAQIAGSLGHESICEVTDLGAMAKGTPYLVMPLTVQFLVDILAVSRLPFLCGLCENSTAMRLWIVRVQTLLLIGPGCIFRHRKQAL